MQGTLFINGKDAYTTWGITLTDSSLSALMTPPSIKVPIENKNTAEDGKEVVGFGDKQTLSPKLDERELSLAINLSARDKATFFARYESFTKELEKGKLSIKTKYQPNTIYHCLYISCSQFGEFMQGIASFVLRLNEPNPRNRQ